MFGIARRVYASYCETYSQHQHRLQRLAGRRELDQDQVEELLNRIDAERACAQMLAGLAELPERDRAVIELADIAGLRPQEAATALGRIAPGTVRMRPAARPAGCASRPSPSKTLRKHPTTTPEPEVTAMTKFADQLFDDLMREHGSTLTTTRLPAPRRPVATRRALLAVSGGGVAVAAAAGVLVATERRQRRPATAAMWRAANRRPTR